MNVRRIQIRVEAGGMIALRLESGFATEPLVSTHTLDPAAALVLAHQIESAVHKAATDGLPLFATPDTQPENPS